MDDFKSRMTELLVDDKAEGLWLQKKDRKLLADKYLDFETIDKVIKEYWGNSIICVLTIPAPNFMSDFSGM